MEEEGKHEKDIGTGSNRLVMGADRALGDGDVPVSTTVLWYASRFHDVCCVISPQFWRLMEENRNARYFCS